MKMHELKPCPFCGGEAEVKSVMDFAVYIAHCKNCTCMLGSLFGDKCDAIEAWNRRANNENA